MSINISAQWGADQWGADPWAGFQGGGAGSQTISPAGLSITVGIGTPYVLGPPQAVLPSGLSVSVGIGMPTIMGPPQTLIIPGLSVQVGIGTPTLVGGATHLQVFIDNVDRSKYLIPLGLSQQRTGGGGGGGGSVSASSGPVTISSSTIGRATCSLDLFVNDGSGYVPRAASTIILKEFGQKKFAGCISTVSTDPVQPNFDKIGFHLACVDKSSICDHRVVLKDYAAGADAAATVLDIVTNFLNGEGITTEGVIITATLGSPITGSHQTVTQVFDTICAQTGATWWVDMNGVLNLSVLASAPAAPISLTSSSDNFRNFTASETTQGYGNKFYAVSNLVVLPGSSNGPTGAARTETYTFINEGGAAWQAAAFAAGLAPGYVLTQLPIGTLVGVKINGSTVAIFPLSEGIQPGHSYYWFAGISTAAVIFPENFLPSIGDVIDVSYIPIYQNSTVNTGTPLTGTCGSGIYEGVIQVPNISLQGDLDAIAAAYQTKNGGALPYICTFETDQPGLAVGQALSCDLPLTGLGTTTLYITQVTLQEASENCVDLGGGSSFRCRVEASTKQSLGNWLNWFENLVARSNYPLPLPRYEYAAFVLAPGSSLGGGNAGVNPYIVQNTGQLYAAVGAAAVAPTNQDLLIDILVNGASVFGGDITKMLRIPAGSTTLHTTTSFASPGMFVYKGDLVTVSVQYSVLATNPTAASGVSANLQWSF
jgi:hypothetical protein